MEFISLRFKKKKSLFTVFIPPKKLIIGCMEILVSYIQFHIIRLFLSTVDWCVFPND